MPGRTVHYASNGYRGAGKTDAQDAYVIADQERMRRDLRPLQEWDEIAVALKILTARRYGDTRQARSLHSGKQRPEHGSRLIREHVAPHNHKVAPDDFEDPLAARSEADRDSLPARSKKRLLVRRDR
ncbi:transposase [Streptomyces lavendulae]|uniref:IS110 family transposase n=1 Tax=Streptomyces lavendulae TaxID=1914 RepID=UPI0036A9B07B